MRKAEQSSFWVFERLTRFTRHYQQIATSWTKQPAAKLCWHAAKFLAIRMLATNLQQKHSRLHVRKDRSENPLPIYRKSTDWAPHV